MEELTRSSGFISSPYIGIYETIMDIYEDGD